MSEQDKKPPVGKHFLCKNCSFYYYTDNFESIDEDSAPDQNTNVYLHTAICPKCGFSNRNTHHGVKNLPKMHLNATGPTTEAGKERSSLNAFKHGAYSQAGIIAPALHGKYSMCATCEFSDDCASKKIKYCPVNLSLMLRVVQGVKDNDISAIMDVHGMTLARVQGIVNQLLSYVEEHGVVEKNKQGAYTINPALNKLPEMVTLAGSSAEQLEMTPKSKSEGKDPFADMIKALGSTTSVLSSVKEVLDSARNAASKAAELRGEDDVLKELEAEGDSDAKIVDNSPSDSPFNKNK